MSVSLLVAGSRPTSQAGGPGSDHGNLGVTHARTRDNRTTVTNLSP